MVFKQHLRLGALTSVPVTVAYSVYDQTPEVIISIFLICIAGSLFPDLDCHSTPSRVVAFVLLLFGSYSLYTKEPYLALILLTSFAFIKAMRHRGWSHTFTLPLVLIICAFKFEAYFLIAFSAGLLTHFWGDSMKVLARSNWYKPYIF